MLHDRSGLEKKQVCRHDHKSNQGGINVRPEFIFLLTLVNHGHEPGKNVVHNVLGNFLSALGTSGESLT